MTANRGVVTSQSDGITVLKYGPQILRHSSYQSGGLYASPWSLMAF